VGDSKALPIIGGVMLVLVLPLVVVVALIVGGLASMDTAAAQCVPSETEGATFAWPTDRHEIDQGWSDPDAEGNNSHSGIDFEIDEGKKVYAAEDGEVVSTAGNEIRIKHDRGVETRYKYVKDISVRNGQTVKRGDPIAAVGSGDETTPGLSGGHLHFELWIDQKNDGNLVNTKPEEDNLFGDEAAPGGGCGCSGLVGSNNQQKAFNYFASNGYSKEQAAGIVGNMIHESGVEPGRKEGTPPGQVTNPSDVVEFSGGWGIVQWTPAGKMITPSREAGVDDAVIGSLEYQLEFLKKQLEGKGPIPEKHAGDMLKRTTTVEDAAVAFGQYYERFLGSENPNHERYTQRKTAAREVLQTFGGTAPSGAGGCGAGNGDIVKTALQLAWDTPNHGHNPKPITPTYEQAVRDHNGSSGEDVLTDCGVFVATVMRMSGVDKEYAPRGTTAQMQYLRNSGKYEIFDNLNNEGQLKPGDIFIIDGHTYLYTGPYKGGDGKTYNAASASLYGHVPEASHVYFSDYRGHYTVARLKQSGAAD
jgi:hypothetical protein